MTIEQLYEWATKNGVKYYNVAIYENSGDGRYRVDSGDLEIDDINKEVLIG